MSSVRVRALSDELLTVLAAFAASQHRLVVLAAEFADSSEWVCAGSPTAAHWLAEAADVEVCTAREWIRVGRRLRELPASADAFERGAVSYSKVRALTRVATPADERELLDIALRVPAGRLGRELAAWIGRNTDPADLEGHQQRQRSVRWHHEPDGMVVFTLRLPPLLAGTLIAFLTKWVMTGRPHRASAEAPESLAQQYCDGVEALLTDGGAATVTEVVIHVRGDGCTLDDGTPVAETVVERVAPESFLRALIHDAESRPINASSRRRHPTTRQKRVVKERDRVCRRCGSGDLLQCHHNPDYSESRRTVVEELELQCAHCHRDEHR